MFHWTIQLEGECRKDQAAVVVGHQIYCFGGDENQCGRDRIEVHIFNTVSLCWRKLTPVTDPGTGEAHLEVPSRRSGHTAVLVGNTVYLWGGRHLYTSKYCKNVLHAFDVDAHIWFKPQVSGTVPKGMSYHTACVLGKVMFIQGGYMGQLYGPTNEIYKLDTSTMVWSSINTRGTEPPMMMADHSATIIGTKMFVFGGSYGWGQYYDPSVVVVFDTETNHWLDTPSTQRFYKRFTHHSAFTYNGELYILGIRKVNQYFNDLWKFNPETFSWKKVETKGKGPSPSTRMCCCMVGDRVILFGGKKRNIENGMYKYTPSDLHVLDLSPSLKTLCKLSVIHHGLDQAELPHNIRWELKAMTSDSN